MPQTQLERVSPEEFIKQLKRAPGWVLIQSPDIPYALELYVKKDDTIEGYLTPDFLEMPPLSVSLFFARLNNAIQDRNLTPNEF